MLSWTRPSPCLSGHPAPGRQKCGAGMKCIPGPERGSYPSPCHPSMPRGQLVQNWIPVAFATRRAPRRKKKCERREMHFRSG